MSQNAFDPPAYGPKSTARNAYLRRLASLSLAGVVVSMITGVLSIWLILQLPPDWHTWILFGLLIGGNLVRTQLMSSGAKFGEAGALAGFLGSSVFTGFGLGYCLIGRVWGPPGLLGNSLATLLAASALTVAVTATMLAVVGPAWRDLTRLGEGLEKVSRPLLIAWIAMFAFPPKSDLVLWISLAFLAVSLASLLYTLNEALHRMPHVVVLHSAHMLALNALFLFWNLSFALTRLG